MARHIHTRALPVDWLVGHTLCQAQPVSFLLSPPPSETGRQSVQRGEVRLVLRDEKRAGETRTPQCGDAADPALTPLPLQVVQVVLGDDDEDGNDDKGNRSPHSCTEHSQARQKSYGVILTTNNLQDLQVIHRVGKQAGQGHTAAGSRADPEVSSAIQAFHSCTTWKPLPLSAP